MPLIYLSCAWVAGIFLGAEFDLPLVLLLTGLIPLPLLLFARHHRKLIVLTSFSLITLFAAATYCHSNLHTTNENDLRFYNDRGTSEIKGMVARDPKVSDKSTHLHLQAAEIKLDEGWQEIKGTALLFVPRYPTYKYGDVLRVTGELETPLQFNNLTIKAISRTRESIRLCSIPK